MVIYVIVLAPKKHEGRDGNADHTSGPADPAHFADGCLVILHVFYHVECADQIENVVLKWKGRDRGLHQVHAGLGLGEGAAIATVLRGSYLPQPT
jgi:hypothetical protein